MAKPNTNMVTSDAVAAAKPHSVRRKALRISIAVLAAVIVGAGGAVGWHVLHDKQDKTPTSNDAVADTGPKQTVSQIATDQAYQGDYDGAMLMLDKNLATATDPSEKSELLSTKATIAYNAEKYQDALTFAQAADAAKSTHSSLVLAAQSAEALGNKKLAITYYQKLVETTKTYEIEEYQAKIKELQS